MSQRILVVDSNSRVRQAARLAFAPSGDEDPQFDLVEADSIAKAAALLGAEAFDIAWIDLTGDSQQAAVDLCEGIRAASVMTPRLVLRVADAYANSLEPILDRLDVDFYLTEADLTPGTLRGVARACRRTIEDYTVLEQASSVFALANEELARQTALRVRLVEQIGDGETGFLADLIRDTGEQPGVSAVAHSGRSVLHEIARRISDVLRPHDFRVNVEETLRKKRVVLLLSDLRALRRMRSALAATVESISATTEPDDALSRLRSGRTDLLYVGWDDRAILPEAIRCNPSMHTVLLTSQRQFEEATPEMFELAAANAVLVSPLVELERSASALSVQELVITAGKIISGDIFGLEKYLAWGVNVREETLVHTDQRRGAINRVLDFAKHCGVRTSMAEKIGLLTDELLMNAMWDAPTDREGRPKYNHLPRARPLALEPHESALLRYASDGNHFAVSVTDRFGRLERDIAYRYVKRCMAQRNPIREGHDGGAGFGLYLAYLSMSHFVVNVLPGKRTEVIGLLDIHLPPREINVRPRRFHYFTERTVRRASPRKSADLPTRVYLPDGTALPAKKINNISVSGAFICTDESLAAGTKLRLEIDLQSQPASTPDTICCDAVVVWATHGGGDPAAPLESGVGVRFESLKPTDRERIDVYMESRPGIPEA